MPVRNEIQMKIDAADCILIGIGEEYRACDNDNGKLICAYNSLAQCLSGKNYFVLSICDDKLILDSDFDQEKIAAPFMDAGEKNEIVNQNPFDRESNPMWDYYMKWLSCTLNKKLLMIELGCLLGSMEIVRWPFEKTVSLNQKSELIRVNATVPFVPAEISDRCSSFKCNSVDFLV